jgi:hypothetical protein
MIGVLADQHVRGKRLLCRDGETAAMLFWALLSKRGPASGGPAVAPASLAVVFLSWHPPHRRADYAGGKGEMSHD